MIGAVRAGIPDYSRAGFREALHNALVHRDYAMSGAAHVFWRDDEIEITNPGGFPDNVNLENLLVTAPRHFLRRCHQRGGRFSRNAAGPSLPSGESNQSGYISWEMTPISR